MACADSYSAAPPFDRFWTDDDIHVGLRMAPEPIVAFRGSVDKKDWLDDFSAWPTLDPSLGYVHAGFRKGMDGVANRIQGALGGRWHATGHSLGAARACVFAALLALLSKPPASLITFGTPRPGFGKLSGLLRSNIPVIRHYRNGPDPVALVPRSFRLLPYQKPVPDTEIAVPPTQTDPIDPFAWHSMTLYLEGMKRLAAV